MGNPSGKAWGQGRHIHEKWQFGQGGAGVAQMVPRGCKSLGGANEEGGGEARHGHKAGLGIRSFQKNVPFFPLFSVIYKRTFSSFRSFTFFIKERSILYVLLCSL